MTASALRLYAHPFSSYCQKVLVALYENATPFEYRHLEHPGVNEELAALWRMKRFPVDEARPYRHYFPLGAPARD